MEGFTFGCICITATLCIGAMLGDLLGDDEARLEGDCVLHPGVNSSCDQR
jgi:hypothetical protein